MNNKISLLQKLMISNKVDCYIVPSHDEFYSEIVPKHNARLKYITNFSGSNGIAVITKGAKHYLFTDGRYLAQASLETNNYFEVIDLATTNFANWIIQYSKKNIIGLNNKLHPINFVENLYKSIKKNQLQVLSKNLIDHIWESRPIPEHNNEVFLYPTEYSGLDTKTKLNNFRQQMRNNNIDTFILNTPESICWLLNIRGNATECTPVVFAYLIVTKATATIFLDSSIDKVLHEYFLQNNIEYCHLSKLESSLGQIKKHVSTTTRAPFWLKEKINQITTSQDPSELPRACKNKTEIMNAIIAHNKDSIALTQCIDWIKKTVGDKNLTELLVSNKLLEFRSQQRNFVCPSFNSIVGFKENGAIIHYNPSAKTNKQIYGNGLLLIDSGGQYLEGTTDTTRTISIGTPTKDEIHNFTLVLKGHIQLVTAIFPKGITGNQLDILARSPLWNEGKDYAHGTGHGVGSFLSVHEGPQGINKFNNVPLQEGMILSIEPGFYKTKKYGIRIENLAYIKKSTRLKGYLEFELLTKVPIETNLIDLSILNKKEKDWLTKYNQECNNLKTE